MIILDAKDNDSVIRRQIGNWGRLYENFKRLFKLIYSSFILAYWWSRKLEMGDRQRPRHLTSVR